MRRHFIIGSTPQAPVALDIRYTCEWNMICKRLLWTANILPTTPGSVYFRRIENNEVPWPVPIASVDPVECELYHWMLTDRIEFQKHDQIQLVYDNPDDLISTVELILEQI